MDRLSRLDPVHGPLQMDVHEHEIGLEFKRHRYRPLTARRETDDFIAERLKLLPEVECDDALILDHEYFGLGHQDLFNGLKCSSNRAPAPSLTLSVPPI
jgi:hypothetical protein